MGADNTYGEENFNPEKKHTPDPWVEWYKKDTDDMSNVRISKEDYDRARECVNTCAGQSIENIKLATAHRDACMNWERTMMELVGEDGIGSVRDSINKLKQQRDKLAKQVDNLKTLLGDAADLILRLQENIID